ncbi:hypothetical protein [Flavobacterium caeni]|nr:hypothetical protein [Flavobacterium caeni]
MLLINSILYNKEAKGKDRMYKILCVYLTLLFVVELFCHIIGFLKPNSNFFLSHYYFNFQFVLLSLFFYHLFADRRKKIFVLAMLVLVTLFLAYQYYTTPGLYWIFNIYEIGITTLLLMLYAGFSIMEFNRRYSHFCFGLIIYLSCSCFIFMSGNTDLVLTTEPFIVDIWVFNSLFYICYQVMIYREWKVLTGR